MTKSKLNPAAGLTTMREPELTVERHKLTGHVRTLDRRLSTAVTAETIAAHIERAQKRGRAELRRIASSGIQAAASAQTGTRSWQDVEALVMAAVLASPAFAEVVEATLVEHLPTVADLAPARAERAEALARVEAIDEELAARRERREREYLKANRVRVEAA